MACVRTRPAAGSVMLVAFALSEGLTKIQPRRQVTFERRYLQEVAAALEPLRAHEIRYVRRLRLEEMERLDAVVDSWRRIAACSSSVN